MIGNIVSSGNYQTVNFTVIMSNLNYDVKLIRKDGTNPEVEMGYNMAQYNEITINSIKFRIAGQARMSMYNLSIKGY